MSHIILFYLIIINLTGYTAMYIDKQKAIKKKWRIPESTLIGIALIGGSIGSYLGMQTFRHKTKHVKFKFGIPFIFFLQILLLTYIIMTLTK